ncbi:MAG: hypothetical protein IPH46_13215 [Bacteroidetes bacterium]|nr:hypothetical protein [Bacteroidota bacterium]
MKNPTPVLFWAHLLIFFLPQEKKKTVMVVYAKIKWQHELLKHSEVKEFCWHINQFVEAAP